MKKYILIIVVLCLVGCSTNKQIQFTQGENVNVELHFIDYGKVQQYNIALRKKIKLKNPYIRFATMKINYFHNGVQIDEIFARPMDYGKDGNLYIIGSEKGEELYEINLYPLSEREIIFEFNTFIEPFKFEGIYKNLKQYIALGKPPIYENGLTGEKYESSNSLIYEEPFSEFKRKNPELLEFLTKGDSIELEVISPVKQKYKFKAEW
ncbi:hypothetical protein [Capnocytophaga stomatis]|uniref:Uncharacterized protein n=1 Tax=Capnocytophaga stomatis TaxID=1848904 RepID=A0A250FZ26_9FLAO|nr:hypothetical protein [Capnocytophaga stomatis]ATA90313.1 hypothetical protein CGC58_11575 [Capnocytophaga stomatis]GIJ94229.1 hypothetical protein CAPN002_14470 [Capnocytophaga stomatis]GIM50965.1 hypothetical protein CAPN003_24170 [Capnocytophaga stomatis]